MIIIRRLLKRRLGSFKKKTLNLRVLALISEIAAFKVNKKKILEM